MLIPLLIILSILNRVYFGEIICVVSNDGIHYKGGFVNWEEILLIKYSVPVKVSRWESCNTPGKVTVECRDRTEILVNAPGYTLSIAKKYCRNVKTYAGKFGWGIAVGILVFGIIIFLFS